MEKPNKKNSRKKTSLPSGTLPCCNLPVIPDRQLNNITDPDRKYLIRYIEKNG